MKSSAALFDSPIAPPSDGEPWTVLHLLRWSTAYLTERDVPGARIDVEHLLAAALDLDRLSLYLRFEQPVSPPELERFRPLLLERARRRPLQYILGSTPFRGIEVAVDERALIPRPETEELVGLVLDRLPEGGRGGSALDVGTGSGVIALSLAREAGLERVVATDISEDATALAAENARSLGLDGRVEVRTGAGYEPISIDERFSAIVSNPPYVQEGELEDLEPEVKAWEPVGALVAGADGLDVVRTLVAGAAAHLDPGGLIAIEVGAGQARDVCGLIERTEGLTAPEILRDVRRAERFVFAHRAQ